MYLGPTTPLITITSWFVSFYSLGMCKAYFFNYYYNSTIYYLQKGTLRKKCPYLELFWSSFFPKFSRIGTEYGEILRVSAYSLRMRENARKMRTRITPNTDVFYVVVKCDFVSILLRDIAPVTNNFRQHRVSSSYHQQMLC